MDLLREIESSIHRGNNKPDDLEQVRLKLLRLTDLMKEKESRLLVSQPLMDFYRRMDAILTILIPTEDKGTQCEVVSEVYRCLRNSVAFAPDNQDLVRETSGIIQRTAKFLNDEVVEKPRTDGSKKLLAEIMLQFLTNCIVNNTENAAVVGDCIKTVAGRLLQKKINGAAYLVHTLLQILPKFSDEVSGTENFQAILDDIDSEGCLLCLESLSQNTEFLRKNYSDFTSEQRVAYLDYLLSSPCKKSYAFFAEEFQRKTDVIMKSDVRSISTDFKEILLLTGLVSSFCEPEAMQCLQSDESLVITAMHLLIMTTSSDEFKPVQKIKQISEEEASHPTFMFKAYIIRLLGNLAYKHHRNQSLIGETCLPIILDCTKVDNLNPFIMQWSILAIRNLLEEHEGNQDVIRQLQPGGICAPALAEAGISIT